jgi:hypothetical protein
MPTQYGQQVKVLKGKYEGYYGRLIGDCSGFELYNVFIPREKINICIRSWNLEGL